MRSLQEDTPSLALFALFGWEWAGGTGVLGHVYLFLPWLPAPPPPALDRRIVPLCFLSFLLVPN